MTTTLPEEYKNKIIDVMGQDLGTLYIELLEELLTLNMKWIVYSLLFRVNKERIDLLNENLSGLVTVTIQDSLLDSIIFSVSYLGDSNKQSFRLGRFVEPLKNSNVNKEIRADLDSLMLLARDTAKDLRDNHIAHHNHEIYSSLNKSFEYSTNEMIDNVLDKAHLFINELALFYQIQPFSCSYKDYAGKIARFFCELSGELTKDDKFGLKLWNKKRQDWKHLQPTLDRFKYHNVYSLIEEVSNDS